MKLTINPFKQLLEKGKKLPDGTRRQYGKFWFKKQGDKWVYDGMASGGATSTPTTPTTGPATAPVQPQPPAPAPTASQQPTAAPVAPTGPQTQPQPPAQPQTPATPSTAPFSLDDRVKQAAARGAEAFRQGLSSASAQDPEFMKLLQGISDPKEANLILEAWRKAWHEANLAAPVSPHPDLAPMTQSDFDGLKDYHTKRNRMSEGQTVQYVGNYWKHRVGQQGTLVAIGNKGFALVRFADGKTETASWKDIKAVGQITPYSLYDKVDPKNVYRIKGTVAQKMREVAEQKIGHSNISYLDLCRAVQKQGFNLQIVGGTVRDILANKKEIKDVDFIFNGSDGELFNAIKKINPSWLANATTNGHLGLCSFNDGGDIVDITPVHKFSHELNDMAKGWNLFDDASARDLAMNTLQVDPLNGVMTDATGKGVIDVINNSLHFADVRALKVAPVYVLRVFKFMARGYHVPQETEDAIRSNLRYTTNLSPHRKERFMRRQIGEKDGAKGLAGFKEAFKKYDAALWDRSFEGIWQGVYRSFGGK